VIGDGVLIGLRDLKACVLLAACLLAFRRGIVWIVECCLRTAECLKGNCETGDGRLDVCLLWKEEE